jgi:preprotein translocase subunit SecE
MGNKNRAVSAKKGRSSSSHSHKSPFAPSSIRDFYHEVVAEYKKIVWPDRKVTVGLTGFVVVLTIVLSLYLGSVDFFLGKLVSMVLQ